MPIVVALTGCSKEPVRTSASTSVERETVSGVVRVAKPEEQGSGKKIFRGVMLERDTNEKWVLSYDDDPLLHAFDGKRVIVIGERYVPKDEALINVHFRPLSWKVEKPSADDSLVSVGEERELRGAFKIETWPEGTKLAGERSITFVSGGVSYRVDRQPEAAKPGVEVAIHARDITTSPFSAHVGGPALYVVSVSER